MAGVGDIRVLVSMAVQGREQIRGAADDLKKMEGAGEASSAGLKRAGIALGAFIGVAGAAAIAGKQLYDTLREGATLITTAERFDKLSESIGTTRDAMLGDLREATQGMISDMDLMASASQIMSLKLADNSEQVTRLATVVGTLGWDMQQVILTFANMSTMRLDALGLSVEEVKSKAAELEAAGMSAQEAFKEAVILAGEARLDVGGVSDAEKSFKQFEASITNVKHELMMTAVELANNIGLIDGLGEAASRISLASQIRALHDELQAIGAMSPYEALIAEGDIFSMSTAELNAKIVELQSNLDGARLIMEHQQLSAANLGDVLGVLGVQYEVVTGEEANFILMTQSVSAALEDVATSGTFSASAIAAWGRALRATAAGDVLGTIADSKFTGGLRDLAGGFSKITKEVAGYSGGISTAISAEDALAAAHARLVDTFNQEINAKPEEGLIDAAGLVNIQAMNDALYNQAQAAGASAGKLALLGVATDKFTAEQAQAALKAAILQEKINQIAEAVASGGLGISDAIGGLDAFRQQLDAGQIDAAAQSVEGLAGAADAFAGQYAAQMTVEDRAAHQAIAELSADLAALTGAPYVITLTTQQEGTALPLPTNVPIPGGIPSGRAGGGTARAGRPYVVGESGPELFIPGQSGTVVPNNQLARLLDWQGGSTYNISVTNYISGEQGEQSVADVTTDRLLAALKGAGLS